MTQLELIGWTPMKKILIIIIMVKTKRWYAGERWMKSVHRGCEKGVESKTRKLW
jgi:hypothetical protein